VASPVPLIDDDAPLIDLETKTKTEQSRHSAPRSRVAASCSHSSARVDAFSSPTAAGAGKSFSLDPFRRMLMGWDSPPGGSTEDEQRQETNAAATTAMGGDLDPSQSTSGAMMFMPQQPADVQTMPMSMDPPGHREIDLVISPLPTDISSGIGMMRDTDDDDAPSRLSRQRLSSTRLAGANDDANSTAGQEAVAQVVAQLQSSTVRVASSGVTTGDKGSKSETRFDGPLAARLQHRSEAATNTPTPAASSGGGYDAGDGEEGGARDVAPSTATPANPEPATRQYNGANEAVRVAAPPEVFLHGAAGDMLGPVIPADETAAADTRAKSPLQVAERNDTNTAGERKIRGKESAKLHDSPLVSTSAVKRERAKVGTFAGPFHPEDVTSPLTNLASTKPPSGPTAETPAVEKVVQQADFTSAPVTRQVPPSIDLIRVETTGTAVVAAASTASVSTHKAEPRERQLELTAAPAPAVPTPTPNPTADPTLNPTPIPPTQSVEPSAPPKLPALSSSIALCRLNREAAVSVAAMPPKISATAAAAVASSINRSSTSASSTVAPAPIIKLTAPSPALALSNDVKLVAPPIAITTLTEPRPPEKNAPFSSTLFGRVVLPTSGRFGAPIQPPASTSGRGQAPGASSTPVETSSKLPPALAIAAAVSAAALSVPVMTPPAPQATVPQTAAAAGAAASARAAVVSTSTAAAAAAAVTAAAPSSPMRNSFRSIVRIVASKIAFMKPTAASSIRAGVDMPLSNLSGVQTLRGNGNALTSTSVSVSSRLVRSRSSSSQPMSAHPAADDAFTSTPGVGVKCAAARLGRTSSQPKTAHDLPSFAALMSASDGLGGSIRGGAEPPQRASTTNDENSRPDGGGGAGGLSHVSILGRHDAPAHGNGTSTKVGRQQPRRDTRHSTGSLPASKLIEEFKAKAAAADGGRNTARGNEAHRVKRASSSWGGAVDGNSANVRRSSVAPGDGPVANARVAAVKAEKGGTTIVLPVIRASSKGTGSALSQNYLRRLSQL